MAGAGYKLFNTGDVLTAAQVNTYLQEQTVMVFANSTARTTALSGVLAEGMMSYLQDTNAVEVYNGTAWTSVGGGGGGDVTEVQAGTGISVASGTGPIPVVTNTMATAIDAEGDLIIGDAADAFQRLAIGSNGNVLTVDTAVDGKIKWAAPSGGGGLTISQLATGTLSGTSTTLASSLTSYDFLMIVVTGYKSASNENFWLTINNNTTDNYSYVFNVQSGSIVSQSSYESSSSGFIITFYDQTAANNTTNQVIFTLQNCKSAGFTTMTKHSRYVIAGPTNTTEAGQGVFRSAAAVSSLEIKTGGTSATGGTFYVFGG